MLKIVVALALIALASLVPAQAGTVEDCMVVTADTAYTPGTARPCTETVGGRKRVDSVTTIAPSSSSTVGIVTVNSSALESNKVIKSSAGNLYGWAVTTGAVQGWVLLFNGTAAPSAGGAAVAPAKCFYAPANASLAGSYRSGPPMHFTTGIVIVFSSSGCLTNTASTTVFISGDAS